MIDKYPTPWKLSEYELNKDPMWVNDPDKPNGGWSTKDFEIVDANGVHVARVHFDTTTGGWPHITHLGDARLIADTIIDAINLMKPTAFPIEPNPDLTNAQLLVNTDENPV